MTETQVDAAGGLDAVRPDTARALLQRVARAQVEGRAPSTAAGLGRGGAVVWSAGRGTLDGTPSGAVPTTDTQYRVGSITKPFTAVAVMRLRDEGLLDLEDRVDQHVPGAPLGESTIRSLLSHTAGLAAEPPGQWWERSPGVQWAELATALGETQALFGPGRRFHYSNPGYALLGQVVEHLRGAPWIEVLQAEVLEPLGLSRTTYGPVQPAAPGIAVHPWADVIMPEVVQDLGAMAPAGQLWSTVADLTRFASFLIGADVEGTQEVLSAATRAEMRETHVVADGPDWASGYGLGVQVFHIGGRELIGHGGSVPGFLAMLIGEAERGTTSIEFANATSGVGIFAGQELLEILETHEPTVARAWAPAATLDADLLALTGVWYWGTRAFTISLRGVDTLLLSPVGGQRGRSSRFRMADGEWVGLDDYYIGEPLRAVRDGSGRLTHLNIGEFVFTREPYDPSAPVPGGVDGGGWRAAGDVP